jgi:hypothetical protein
VVGVINNIPKCTGGTGTNQTVCGLPIYSLDLVSTNPICGFDGDGINTFGAPGNSMDQTGYGGPNAYFTNVNAAQTSCRVNFVKPIPAAGGTAYFSLENSLTSSTACSNAINASICDGNGVNCGGTKPNVPTLFPGTNKIAASFVPQGTNPNTGKKYTLAEAAAVCGFLGFNWQQIVNSIPAGVTPPKDAAGVAQVAPWNDPPLKGYQYQLNDPNLGNVANAVRIPVYYNMFTPPGPAYKLSVQSNTTGTSQLNFTDAPGPFPNTVSFTTHLVGVVGPAATPTSPPPTTVVDTGMGFDWASNYNGTAGLTVFNGWLGMPVITGGTGAVTVNNVFQITTYTGVVVSAVNGSTNIFGPTSLLSAVLPASRSAQPSGTVTAFATVINTGTTTATGCSIAPALSVPTNFAYQTTNSATNALTGSPNTPVDIPAGASQSFVVAFTPAGAINPTDMAFNFSCTNTPPAPIVSGLNTLLLSASTTGTPDVVALAATIKNDGIVHLTGSPLVGAFAVATVDLGISGSITVGANTGSATLPLTITMCQTNPSTGQCLQTPSATVATSIANKATPTFGIFVAASTQVPLDPANSRIFVTFTDSGGAVRGETSVAVTTQ